MKQADWEALTDAEQAEFLANRLRRRLDRVLAEGKVSDLLRHFADLTAIRINAVHEALDEGDVLKAWRILYWAEEAFGLAVDRWYAPAVAFSEPFRNKSTESAERGKGRKASAREKHIMEMAQKWLAEPGLCRFASGKINFTCLAKMYRYECGTHLSERRVREILAEAILR